MNTIVPFPGAPAEMIPIDEADIVLLSRGDPGHESDGTMFRWASDYPLTTSVCELVRRNLAEAGEDQVPLRSSQARDVVRQLRLQADAFSRNAAALLSLDAGKLGSDGPGLGARECRELISAARLLSGPAGLTAIEARQQVTETIQRVAAAFTAASSACAAWAAVLTALRQEKDGERMSRRVAGYE